MRFRVPPTHCSQAYTHSLPLCLLHFVHLTNLTQPLRLSSRAQLQKLSLNSQAVKIQRPSAWQPTPVFLPGKSHGWRNMVGQTNSCLHITKRFRPFILFRLHSNGRSLILYPSSKLGPYFPLSSHRSLPRSVQLRFMNISPLQSFPLICSFSFCGFNYPQSTTVQNSRNKQFRSFKLQAILNSMMKSCTVLPCLAGRSIIPLTHHQSLSHLSYQINYCSIPVPVFK